jgi:hypothetical protein
VDIPEFLLRKLYRRGSLRETSPGMFRFELKNTLAGATVINPPHVIVNGIGYDPPQLKATKVDLGLIGPDKPFRFGKGDTVTLKMPGSLLRGGNQIEVLVHTKEFGDLRIEAEDSSAEFCDLPGAGGGDSED